MDSFKTALAIVAWLGCLCSPPLVATLSWKLAHRIQSAWLIHLVFVPCVLVVQWLLAVWLFWASGDSGDGPPGLALVPCLASMLFSIVIYFICLAVVIMQKRKQNRLGRGQKPHPRIAIVALVQQGVAGCIQRLVGLGLRHQQRLVGQPAA